MTFNKGDVVRLGKAGADLTVIGSYTTDDHGQEQYVRVHARNLYMGVDAPSTDFTLVKRNPKLALASSDTEG